jgi:hypothetical protein
VIELAQELDVLLFGGFPTFFIYAIVPKSLYVIGNIYFLGVCNEKSVTFGAFRLSLDRNLVRT